MKGVNEMTKKDEYLESYLANIHEARKSISAIAYIAESVENGCPLEDIEAATSDIQDILNGAKAFSRSARASYMEFVFKCE